jgi:3-oxocholest-4-en-26-oyl-CoA dehydrogenase beta subunit
VDFEKSSFQNELAGLVREIFAGRGGGGSLDGGGFDGRAFDAGVWRELGKAGVLAAALPESLGGDGLGLLEQCSVLVEIGRALAPAPFLGSIVLGATAIATFGTPEQQQRWAEPAGRGELVLTAALEQDDTEASPATAEPAGAGAAGAGRASGSGGAGAWLLSGVRTAVPAAPWADVLLVPAAVAGSAPDDAGVFVVERAAAGVTVEPQELTDGVTAGRITFDRASAQRLGGAEAGTAARDWLIARGTVGLCALQLGVTERALELTAEYATSRVQFGRPIGSFQAVAQRLADAWIDVSAIRLTMWQAAWRLSANLPCDTAVSSAKFWAADAGHRVAHTAVHVHGGVGIDVSHPLHRYFAAATHHEFALGGATAQLLCIGAELAKVLDHTKFAYGSIPFCSALLRSPGVDSSQPSASPAAADRAGLLPHKGVSPMLRRLSVLVGVLALSAGTAIAAQAAPVSHASVTPSAINPGGIAHLIGPVSNVAGGVKEEESSNWSGWADTTGTFSSVSASWVQPAGTCSSGDQYAAFWVGIDGYSSSTVEQTGSEVDCVGRTAEYYAWYEMYPGPSENYSNTVKAGDHFKATVTWISGDKFSLYIDDSTQGWSHTTDASLTSTPARSSAEVITEAPCCTNSGGILNLTDFGTVSYTGATANGEAIGTAALTPEQIYIADGSGNAEDSTSALTGGEAFSNTWIRKN